MRPFFPYYGSKWNIARYYPAPLHPVVIEPFAGSAGYALYYDAPRVILVDVDPYVTGVWQYLMRTSMREIAQLPELPEVGDTVDNYNLPQEAAWLIGFWLNRGSATPKKTRTAYSARTDRSQLTWGPRAKARIIAQLPGLVGWEVSCASYVKAPVMHATWFVDPPYGDKGRYYRMPFSDYVTLGTWCRTCPGQVIVCEGPGACWLPFEPLGSFKSTRGRANEFIYVGEHAQ